MKITKGADRFLKRYGLKPTIAYPAATLAVKDNPLLDRPANYTQLIPGARTTLETTSVPGVILERRA
jgi:hypothetical protein